MVDLEQHAARPASRQPSFGAGSAAAAPQQEGNTHAAAPLALPAGADRGLVDAALVCLSTGSSGERQHTFAQQLIRQLAALGDALLPQRAQQHDGAADQGVWGPPVGRSHAAAAAAAVAAASPAAVQVSVWLRLALLLPLLPLVYKHRTADASNSLRAQLLRALLRLLAVPAVRADAAVQAAAEAAAAPSCGASWAATAAAAAAEAAGEPLPQRLLHLLQALLVGGWASWMRLQGEGAAACARLPWPAPDCVLLWRCSHSSTPPTAALPPCCPVPLRSPQAASCGMCRHSSTVGSWLPMQQRWRCLLACRRPCRLRCP